MMTTIDTFIAAYITQMNNFASNNSRTTFQLTTSNTTSVVKNPIRDSAGDSHSSFLY
jgi:signal recognition particle GTPase